MEIENTALKLCNQSECSRNEKWEQDFLLHFPQTKLRLLYPDAKPGPDHFPYLFAALDEQGTEPTHQVLHWLAQRGIGLVINPQKNVPDYVFTYGMIWSYDQSNQFRSHASNNSQPFELSTGENVLAGPPSEGYLPLNVRSLLKQFFLDQGILNVRVLVISKDQQNFDLCFSLESLKNPATNEHKGILEAVSWFLPPHYSLVLVSENGLPPFHSL